MIVEFRRLWGLRKIGFRFDILAVKLMCDQHGLELHETAKIPKDEYLSSYCYGGHVSYSMYHFKKPVLSKEGVKKFIDKKMNKIEWEQLLAAMVSARGKEGQAGDEKKK